MALMAQRRRFLFLGRVNGLYVWKSADEYPTAATIVVDPDWFWRYGWTRRAGA